MHNLYSVGYLLPESHALLTTLVKQGYIILDVRKRAGSRYRPEFSAKRLKASFGDAYQRCKALGNEHYQHPELPHLITDPERGIQELISWLSIANVVLLCRCQNPDTCHIATIQTWLEPRKITCTRLPEKGHIHATTV